MRFALSLFLAAAAVGCGGDDPPVVTWTAAFDQSQTSFLSGVWGSGPDDVFMVGGNDQDAEIHHYNGTSWDRQVLPGTGLLIWVSGFSATDVYAVGLGGTMLHYDGAAWSPITTPTTQDLWGVWGAAPDDIWIVGGNIGDGSPVLLHYDGTVFQQFALAASENPLGVRALFKVFGVDGRVFAVGQQGLIVEHVDGAWLRRPAGADANDDFIALYGTSLDDLVIVGGRGSARIATFDGQNFVTSRPEAGGTNAIFVDTSGTYVGGIPGFAGTYDPGSDEVVVEQRTDSSPHAMWGDGQGTLYTVGGRFEPPYTGLALIRSEQ